MFGDKQLVLQFWPNYAVFPLGFIVLVILKTQLVTTTQTNPHSQVDRWVLIVESTFVRRVVWSYVSKLYIYHLG